MNNIFKIKKLSSKVLEGKKTLRKIIPTFIVRASGAFGQLAMNIILARYMGVEGAGQFFLAYTITVVGTIIGRFGFDLSLIRFVGSIWIDKKLNAVRGLFKYAYITTICISSLVSAAVWLSAPILANDVFHNGSLINTFRWMAFSIVPLSLVWVSSGMLKAIRKPAWGSAVEVVIVPLFVSAGCVLLGMIVTINSEIGAKLFFFGCLFSALISIGILSKNIPSGLQDNKNNSVLLKASIPIFVITFFDFIVTWSSSLILGSMTSVEEVGLYNIAHRTSSLIVFILIVVNTITAPKYAHLFHQGKMTEMSMLAMRSAFVMTLLVFPILLVIIIFPRSILWLYGAEFYQADMMFQIIAVGQFINVVTGSVGYILVMTGNEKLLLKSTAFVAVITVSLNFVFIPMFSGIGAAIVTALSLSLTNLINVWLVYKKLGIITIPGFKKLAVKNRI